MMERAQSPPLTITQPAPTVRPRPMSPIGNTGRLHFPYDWNALPRQAASRLESFASTVVSSRSLVLTGSVRFAGKLHDLKCRLISSDTRSPALRPDIIAWTLRRYARRRPGADSLAPVRLCALSRLTLFRSHVFDPLNRGCFGARNAPAFRALCVIGTPASQGKPYATLRHKHGGGGDGGIRKLVLDRLRQSEGAILLLLFAAVVVAAVRFGRGE